jgi:hypothetical protein
VGLAAACVLTGGGPVAAAGALPHPGPAGTGGMVAGGGAAGRAAAARTCQHAFVPAYFWSGSLWAKAIGSEPAPRVVILNVTGVGAGPAPVKHWQTLAAKARATGVTVIGYASTDRGARPLAQVEADVRHYKAWYKAGGMFFDLASATTSGLPYYRKLAKYTRTVNRKGVIWLNPGSFPVRQYMAVANVIMVFEGSYASYRGLHVPAWTKKFQPGRFAHVIYAAPSAGLSHALSLARSRRAGYAYVTSHVGANPYNGVPGYWKRETATLERGCKPASTRSS